MGGKSSKNRIKRLIRSIKTVRTWQLFLILIPLCFLVATLLRFNHLKMVDLRAAVLAADADEDDERIAAALTELKEFVFSHIVVNIVESNGNQSISFGTGPFYLEHTYQRAANAAIASVEDTLIDDSNPNGNIYDAVRQICQPLAIANGWNWTSPGYLECWTSELAKYPASDTLVPNAIMAAIPSTELYRHEYSSPVWAPTIAGFLALACVIIALIVLIRTIIWVVLKLALLFIDTK